MGDSTVLVGTFGFIVVLLALAKMQRQLQGQIRTLEALTTTAKNEAQDLHKKTSSLESKLDDISLKMAGRKEDGPWKV